MSEKSESSDGRGGSERRHARSEAGKVLEGSVFYKLWSGGILYPTVSFLVTFDIAMKIFFFIVDLLRNLLLGLSLVLLLFYRLLLFLNRRLSLRENPLNS